VTPTPILAIISIAMPAKETVLQLTEMQIMLFCHSRAGGGPESLIDRIPYFDIRQSSFDISSSILWETI
jgi:hypothetical protein